MLKPTNKVYFDTLFISSNPYKT